MMVALLVSSILSLSIHLCASKWFLRRVRVVLEAINPLRKLLSSDVQARPIPVVTSFITQLECSLYLYKQRVWILGARPEEEETFQFTMIQRIGGCWDGYWLTESVLHDGDGFTGAVAYWCKTSLFQLEDRNPTYTINSVGILELWPGEQRGACRGFIHKA